MKTCIISDIHFKYLTRTEEDKDNNQRILRFLDSIIGEYDQLILNGDVFDLWFDWEYGLIKQYFPILKKLADIVEHGCKIRYISGNHDFWFNDFFSYYMDVELYQDGYSFEDTGKRVLVAHGDLYTVNDLRYKLFRSLIRLRIMKRLFALIHPYIALSLGSKLSRTSRKRTSPPESRRLKTSGLELYATKQILHHGYDYVIMGHSHEPLLKAIEHGYYANCGDWVQHFSYVKIIDGKIELCSFARS
ncbi:MAG: UDP-2,3-diacylglucosamine hydrolase [Candidatus Cloacimonetes bacterium HGW-Cloacimonetes-1]|jgi:UDP-2,3-diacylglucosamine hydrolase|nr:MAG: UDP-2,3-diacylglucosamine hydrolase [Candidatus Cloacimonetes bacterium HGW-Cloacimonetes-1]